MKDNKKLLVVLDYSNSSVHFYRVDEGLKIDENFISKIGHHPSNSEWMYAPDVEIIWHNGINDD